MLSDRRFLTGLGLVLTMLVGGRVSGAPSEGKWALAPIGPTEERLELPALAVVQFRDGSGKTWDVTGRISGDLPVAAADFGMCLSGQGWRWHSDMVMGETPRRVRLSVWTKGERRLLVMMWERGAGQSGFAVGEEKNRKEEKRIDQEGLAL